MLAAAVLGMGVLLASIGLALVRGFQIAGPVAAIVSVLLTEAALTVPLLRRARAVLRPHAPPMSIAGAKRLDLRLFRGLRGPRHDPARTSRSSPA